MHGPIDETHAAPAPSDAAIEGLSNDYLNHYSEVLMLVELAAQDPDAVDDLAAWRPVDYPTYFGASHLRRAPAARAAYEALPDERRAAFEALTRAMDNLSTTAIRALRPPCEPDDAAHVAEVTGPALRRLIARASAFLNSGGRELPDEAEVEAAQRATDRLLERTLAETG
ncbi:hypothetical protein [Salinarimonas ramus]|uniref:Uncharacterized protein n=1 Tax=Salinarimonas ramus TaxID=690164 RepID=A0A917Q4S9_9HYPH|nr:hypothetical protein [Salinarimonas ramus]GGK24301.1 hypothetical protein GCM10011322_08690 [Salinarimonas ramus]